MQRSHVQVLAIAGGLCVLGIAGAGWWATQHAGAGPQHASNQGASPQTFPLGKIEVVRPTTPAEGTYVTRGRVEGLPEATFRPGGVIYLQLHHEVIPEFVGPTGKVEGMREMIMDFPTISPDVSLAGFAKGDAVAITFEVRWTSEPRFILTKLERLPAGTTLNLSEVVRTGN